MKVPEGSFLNCRYPAACGNAPALGGILTSAASQCIAKMLYAAGIEDDVNASWYGSAGAGEGANTGGPGFFYGGHNQYGMVVGQGLYDMHASGFGAAPYRDGVPTGGHMNNPTRRHFRHREYRAAVSAGLFEPQSHDRQRRLRQVSRRPGPAAHHHGLRHQRSDRQLLALSRHSRRMGPVRRLSDGDRRPEICAWSPARFRTG